MSAHHQCARAQRQAHAGPSGGTRRPQVLAGQPLAGVL